MIMWDIEREWHYTFGSDAAGGDAPPGFMPGDSEGTDTSKGAASEKQSVQSSNKQLSYRKTSTCLIKESEHNNRYTFGPNAQYEFRELFEGGMM